MKIETFLNILEGDFFTGVPDSQLKALCDYLMGKYGIDPKHHIIAANEGNAAAIAAGYHLATGKVPVVYLQNSGEGNLINPLASLLNERVYGIPEIFVIGWRGEPGVHDEPQHSFQGMVTLKLLEDMEVSFFVVDQHTTEEELKRAMEDFRPELSRGGCVAFVIRKGALSLTEKRKYQNEYCLRREEAIGRILRASGEDPVICTTGKASRELFELRESFRQGHQRDFLTVGSMGHASSIALGVALHQPGKRIWCIDGDGAALMHLGAMPLIGSVKPENLIHVVINNGAHETVGGQPTAETMKNLAGIAEQCGYPLCLKAEDGEALDKALITAVNAGVLTLLEVRCALGAREDLGRPTTTTMENKRNFMTFLSEGGD